MNLRKQAEELLYPMVSYAQSIYECLCTLCELEKAGKKQERAYYNVFNNLKGLLDEESKFYRDNIDKINQCRGDLFYLATIHLNPRDKNMFDLLSEFDPLSIYERIKTKLRYHIGFKKTFNSDFIGKLRAKLFDQDKIYGAFLDETFLTDMQRMSLFYIDSDHFGDQKNIDYKYLSALLFNLDQEFVSNYFEVSKQQLFLDSSLTYGINGIYDEMYREDLIKVLITKFPVFVDYIIKQESSSDDDKEFKIDIALSYLKSILDLLPLDVKEEFYNDFIMSISNDGGIPLDAKLRIMDAMRDADRGRKLLRHIEVGTRES